jgi:hypothetical protein
VEPPAQRLELSGREALILGCTDAHVAAARGAVAYSAETCEDWAAARLRGSASSTAPALGACQCS